MQTSNPYAPPQTQKLETDADTGRTQQVRAFSYKGRIGRLRYLAYTVVAYVAMIAAAAILGALCGALGLPTWIASTLALVPYFVCMVMWTIQRSHDMNWSGWLSLLAIVPLVGLVWIFKRGTDGENNYGAPTPPNTLGVKLLALVLPFVAIVGIVAAVALPAYQDYVKRARAHQAQMAPAPASTGQQ